MKKYISMALSVLLVLCLTACGGPKEVTDMALSVPIGDITMSGYFTGTVEEKLPNGQGTFTYSDGPITVSYTGSWENGVPVGEGNLEYAGFKVKYGDAIYEGNYEGKAVAGLPNGEGTFSISNNEIVFIYSGEWKNGAIAGSGKLEFNKLVVNYSDLVLVGNFSGEVVDGIPCGYGEFISTTEETHLTYKGNWKEGAFSEAGVIDTNMYTVHFKDGINRTGKYVGDVYNGLAEGEGTFAAVNSEGTPYTYVGAWKNGLYNGTGTCHWDADDVYTQKGTFVDGEFFPSPLEFFIAKGTYPDEPYEITENALAFLEKHPEVFLDNEVNNDEIEYEKNFQYKAFEKNPNKYGTKLITVPSLRVVQIFEHDYWGREHTFIIAQDGSYNVYYINIFGYWDNIYEGSYIKLTALPLDYFTYPNTAGQSIWAIACAGVRIN